MDLFFKVLGSFPPFHLYLLYVTYNNVIYNIYILSSLISTILERGFFLCLVKVFETTVIQVLTPT